MPRKGFPRLFIVKYNFVGFGSIDDDTMKNTGKKKIKRKKMTKNQKKY